MTVGNTLFKKRASHLVIYESGPSKAQVDYRLVRRKCKTERRRFGNVMQQKDKKCDVFKTAKSMVKTNQDIIGEQCIRNDYVVLVVK